VRTESKLAAMLFPYAFALKYEMPVWQDH